MSEVLSDLELKALEAVTIKSNSSETIYKETIKLLLASHRTLQRRVECYQAALESIAKPVLTITGKSQQYTAREALRIAELEQQVNQLKHERAMQQVIRSGQYRAPQ